MSKLTFHNLSSLIPSMNSANIDKEHFSFHYAKHKIDCILSFSHQNYELLVAVHLINFGFVVPIIRNQQGLYIAEITEDIYYSFCRVLGLSYQKDNFTSNVLLNLLSSNIPKVSSKKKLPYEFLQKYVKCRHINESNKIYFKGWNDHSKDKKNARNFDKTEFFLGKRVADYCRKNNISSLWTDIPREQQIYHDPWID